MVGLPARGKSYTAQKLARYLMWLGYITRVFNVGQKRREVLGAHHPAEFFSPTNQEGRKALRAVAAEAFSELVDWLHTDGQIAIYDATNSTRERRDLVRRRCAEHGFESQLIELINDDPTIIERNVRDTKLRSPDYEGVDPEEAVRDFRQRISLYESTYNYVEDDEGSYIKLINQNRKVVWHEIDGYIPARIAAFLSSCQITERPVWLTRHGESLDNVAGRLGGDASLSPKGREYARSLSECVSRRFNQGDALGVWTSTHKRTVQTGMPLKRGIRKWRALDEINAGVCEGLTYEEIRQRMPSQYEARRRDKLRYCYPHGESYEDVIQRLDRVIMEIERQQGAVLVIAHQAVLRALYGYFQDTDVEGIPYLSIPLHTVVKLMPHAYGCDEERETLPPAVVNTGS